MKSIDGAILRAAKAGDVEEIEEIISRSEMPERKRPHDREFMKETRGKRRKQSKNPSMEIPAPVEQEEVIEQKEETEVKTQRIQEKGNKPQEPSPFITALIAARKINTREPSEQPKEMETLKKAMDLLNEDGKRSIVFRLVNEVLEDKTSLQCLFPAARIAGMSSTAHSVAAIRRAIREGGLTFSDLTTSGLAEIRKNEKQLPYTVYRVGHDALVKAEEALRKDGKKLAAECLAVHLRRGERNRALAEAAKTVTQPAAEVAAAQP